MGKKGLTRRADGLYEKVVTVQGKRHHFYGKTQKEAIQKAYNFTEDKAQGVTFGEMADAYYEEYLNEHPSSYRYIKWHYERLKKAFGDDRASRLTARDFTTFFATLSDKSYKTVRACKSVAQCIYNFGIVNYELESNPVDHRRMPPALKRGRRDMPAPDIIERVKKNTDAPNALLFLMALYTGLRRGELLALQYQDIDYDKRLVKVSKSVYFASNEPIIKQPKTDAGKRTVVLLEPLVGLIPPGEPEAYIFGGDRPWTARMIERRIDAYRKATGLDVTLHQLRHRFATILYEAGVDERMRMDLLGHANISTTKNIYTHIRTERKKRAADILNAYLKESQ